MLLLAEQEILIQRPVAEVFAYATNMENYGQWFPGVVEIVSHNALPHGEIGKQYVETLKLPLGKTRLQLEVKQVEPNRLFATEGDLKIMLPMMKMTFVTKASAACLFHLSYFSRNPKLGEKHLVTRLLRADLGRRIVIAMQQLKHQLE